jgi:hypothetical protein
MLSEDSRRYLARHTQVTANRSHAIALADLIGAATMLHERRLLERRVGQPFASSTVGKLGKSLVLRPSDRELARLAIPQGVCRPCKHAKQTSIFFEIVIPIFELLIQVNKFDGVGWGIDVIELLLNGPVSANG